MSAVYCTCTAVRRAGSGARRFRCRIARRRRNIEVNALLVTRDRVDTTARLWRPRAARQGVRESARGS